MVALDNEHHVRWLGGFLFFRGRGNSIRSRRGICACGSIRSRGDSDIGGRGGIGSAGFWWIQFLWRYRAGSDAGQRHGEHVGAITGFNVGADGHAGTEGFLVV